MSCTCVQYLYAIVTHNSGTEKNFFRGPLYKHDSFFRGPYVKMYTIFSKLKGLI